MMQALDLISNITAALSTRHGKHGAAEREESIKIEQMAVKQAAQHGGKDGIWDLEVWDVGRQGVTAMSCEESR